MTSWREQTRAAARLLPVAAAIAAAGTVGVVVAQDLASAEAIVKLKLPLEHHANGQVRTELQAEKAWVPARGPMVGEGVRVECFDELGQRELIVTAGALTFDRATGVATSAAPVRATATGVTFSGRGLRWDTKEQTIHVDGDVKLIFNGKIRELGAKR